MNRKYSQLPLGIVCVILGLMISIQFKTNNNTQNLLTNKKIMDISQQLDDLKIQKDNLEKKVQEYQKIVDDYEKAVTAGDNVAKQMKDELDRVRKLAGLTDVEGRGIQIEITPAIGKMGEGYPLDYCLMEIVNSLNSAGAEAISINDERFVSRTQIVTAGVAIKINDTKFDPTQRFIVKAIGNPSILEGAFKIPESIVEIMEQQGDEVKFKQMENIKILKYNKVPSYEYVKEGR